MASSTQRDGARVTLDAVMEFNDVMVGPLPNRALAVYSSRADSDFEMSSSSSAASSPIRHRGSALRPRGRQMAQVSGSVAALNDDDRRRAARADRVYNDDGGPGRPRPDAPGGEHDDAGQAEAPCLPSPERMRCDRELGQGLGVDHCFACKVLGSGDNVPPACQSGLECIYRLLRDSCGQDKVQVARTIKALFDSSVRDTINGRLMAGQQPCPEWHVADIYDHFFTQKHGRIDASASLEQRIAFFERALQDMRDKYVYTSVQSATGEAMHVPDPRRLGEAMKVSQLLDRMYLLQPTKMPLAIHGTITLRASDYVNHRPQYRSLPTRKQANP